MQGYTIYTPRWIASVNNVLYYCNKCNIQMGSVGRYVSGCGGDGCWSKPASVYNILTNY